MKALGEKGHRSKKNLICVYTTQEEKMELCEATIKLCHQIGTSVALIFFNK